MSLKKQYALLAVLITFEFVCLYGFMDYEDYLAIPLWKFFVLGIANGTLIALLGRALEKDEGEEQ